MNKALIDEILKEIGLEHLDDDNEECESKPFKQRT